MVNLPSVLVWCYRFLVQIGPILGAVNAAWSLYNKIHALVTETKSSKGSD